MKIEHASLLQVQKGLGGKKVLIENDVLDVVKQLQEISPDLFVNYIEQGDYFAIVENCPDGVERLVTTVKDLTPAVVEHIRKIGSDSWDAVAEMERTDDAASANKKHEFGERVGEIGERLHHALRKDFQAQDKIWVPS